MKTSIVFKKRHARWSQTGYFDWETLRTVEYNSEGVFAHLPPGHAKLCHRGFVNWFEPEPKDATRMKVTVSSTELEGKNVLKGVLTGGYCGTFTRLGRIPKGNGHHNWRTQSLDAKASLILERKNLTNKPIWVQAEYY